MNSYQGIFQGLNANPKILDSDGDVLLTNEEMGSRLLLPGGGGQGGGENEGNAFGSRRDPRRYEVQYEFAFLGQPPLSLMPMIGKVVSFGFSGNIACQGCQKPIKKVFQTGVCFVCSQKLARCDLCIVKPERCHFHLGTCREPEWGEAHCMQEHAVYLANSSGLKVGITRIQNIPYRWMDQGAIQALPFLIVTTRRFSGLIETKIAERIPDKTNWRKMLKNEVEPLDLWKHRESMFESIQPELERLKTEGVGNYRWIDVPEQYEFFYPVLEYPVKVDSLSFDKTPLIEGKLMGIKGQYLIIDHGVLNLGKFEGYELRFSSEL
jgi:hypothetical protein